VIGGCLSTDQIVAVTTKGELKLDKASGVVVNYNSFILMDYLTGLVTVKDVARLRGVGEETVRRWVWSGKLPAQKLGNQLFIKEKDLRLLPSTPHKRKPGGSTLRAGFIKEARELHEEIKGRTGMMFDPAQLLREYRGRA
jgi:excisionase family DNA binding protein